MGWRSKRGAWGGCWEWCGGDEKGGGRRRRRVGKCGLSWVQQPVRVGMREGGNGVRVGGAWVMGGLDWWHGFPSRAIVRLTSMTC